jgi:hypothetical protein
LGLVQEVAEKALFDASDAEHMSTRFAHLSKMVVVGVALFVACRMQSLGGILPTWMLMGAV